MSAQWEAARKAVMARAERVEPCESCDREAKRLVAEEGVGELSTASPRRGYQDLNLGSHPLPSLIRRRFVQFTSGLRHYCWRCIPFSSSVHRHKDSHQCECGYDWPNQASPAGVGEKP